ncbi:MAG: hypothetical protein AAFV80_21170 [Bacteroidota bacterium]
MTNKHYTKFLIRSISLFCWVFLCFPNLIFSQENPVLLKVQLDVERPGINEFTETMDWLELKMRFYGYPLESFEISRKENTIELSCPPSANISKLQDALAQKEGFGIAAVHKFDDKTTMTSLFEALSAGRLKDAQQRTVKLESIFDLNTTTIEGYDFRRFPPAVIGMAAAQHIESINQFLAKAEIQALLPANSRFLWAEKPSALFSGKYDLYLIQTQAEGLLAPLVAASTNVYKKANRYNRVRDLIDIELSENEFEAMETLSTANINRELLIIFDGKALSAPLVQGPIRDGKLTIEGLFEGSEAIALGNLLRTSPPPFGWKVSP